MSATVSEKKVRAARAPAPVATASLSPGEAAIIAEYSRPALLGADQVDRLNARFSGARSSLSMLVFLFGDETALSIRTRDNRDLVMGLVQHVDNLLNQLHGEISQIAGTLPDDLTLRTYEAHCIVAVLERVEFDRGFSLEAFSDPFLCGYFESAIACIDLARTSLKQHAEVSQ